MLRNVALFVLTVSCTPTSVSEAEKKHDVPWLVQHASPEAMGALGRLADDDQPARDALEKLGNDTAASGGKALDGGATALDVYLAAWAAVERNEEWGKAMIKRGLGERERMNAAASAIKRGSAPLAGFLPDLDAALRNGCDVRCGSALASGAGEEVTKLVTNRLLDGRTREAMCDGIGSQESSKDARAVFMGVPAASRDAMGCPGAAARMAAHDDEALAWLAKAAEPGLLRATGTDVMPCDRLVKLWTTALVSRDHTFYGALAIPLGSGVKHCPKAIDGLLAATLASDADSATLAVAAIDPFDATGLAQLPLSCGALPNVARTSASAPIKARALDALAKCGK